MKLVDTVYGNDDPATSLTVLQGLLTAHPNLARHHLADHGRHLHRGAVPRQAQGPAHARDADRSRPAVADEAVRPRRHGEAVRAVEPERPRLPRRLRGGGPRLRQGVDSTTGVDVQRRQARHVHRARPGRRHRAVGRARPAHRVRHDQHRRTSTSDRSSGAAAGPGPGRRRPTASIEGCPDAHASASACRSTRPAGRVPRSGTPRSGRRCGPR